MEKEISNDDLYLVIASDGLWDVMSNEDVAKFLMNISCFTDIAKELCYEATILGSSDNITVVVVDLKSDDRSLCSQNNSGVTPLSRPEMNGDSSHADVNKLSSGTSPLASSSTTSS